MSDNPRFAQLVSSGQPTGEVVGVNRFLTTVRGLGAIAVNALVYFENGHTGMVREVGPENTMILNLTAESMPIGTLAVLDSDELTTGVGDALIGRVVSVMGEPLDGKGPIKLPDRACLDDQTLASRRRRKQRLQNCRVKSRSEAQRRG